MLPWGSSASAVGLAAKLTEKITLSPLDPNLVTKPVTQAPLFVTDPVIKMLLLASRATPITLMSLAALIALVTPENCRRLEPVESNFATNPVVDPSSLPVVPATITLPRESTATAVAESVPEPPR